MIRKRHVGEARKGDETGDGRGPCAAERETAEEDKDEPFAPRAPPPPTFSAAPPPPTVTVLKIVQDYPRPFS